MAGTQFAPGSLVRARGREWIVLPESKGELLVVRPLGGTEAEQAGIWLPLERVEPASFAPPDPARPGDFLSCRLLREAVRLGVRSGTGPFRSFARLAVEPRPYQLVPLLMALKLDPVRLLIADDVGIGKTIEAALVARELLDRGEARRLSVLCPPHLAEQWQAELATKFHIEAELVLAGTAARLERHCRVGESIFDRHPFTIVSLDFIKTDRHREQFLLGCPELVLVDEAHACADTGEGRGARHQRHRLLRDLAKSTERHLLLVTATPHSGKDAAFRSLLGLLSADLAALPEDLTGDEHRRDRELLARYFVQRRRADIRRYLETDTSFPDRKDADATYQLSPGYKSLLETALDWARETAGETAGDRRRQRVRWWSALALLRAISSSPAAASATLRTRATTAEAEDEAGADEQGRATVMDVLDEQPVDAADADPGADCAEPDTPERRRLLAMARQADALKGDADPKLVAFVPVLRSLLQSNFNPIVFCRFIATAEYLAEGLRARLGAQVEIEAVTGTLPPADREARIAALGAKPKRVLVATDCLSEGINLQQHFDAVLHYDLSWNPTRHEQREGRVDRFGQRSREVRVVTFFGANNEVDGWVLEVLLRKHESIRKTLGISVPVPVDSQQVLAAIMEGVLRRRPHGGERQLDIFKDVLREQSGELEREWQRAADREKRSRTLFAQETIKTEEVAAELAAVREALGDGGDLREFVRAAVAAHGGRAAAKNGELVLDLAEAPRALREVFESRDHLALRFQLPVGEDEVHVTRTHPLVERLASFVVSGALDPELGGVARRSGAIRTRAVGKRTTLLLARFRFDLAAGRGAEAAAILAEECALLGFRGAPETAEWLEPGEARALLDARPDANIPADQAAAFVAKVVESLGQLAPRLEAAASERAQALLDAHTRVRRSARVPSTAVRVKPHLPPDVLGVYVLLPVTTVGAAAGGPNPGIRVPR